MNHLVVFFLMFHNILCYTSSTELPGMCNSKLALQQEFQPNIHVILVVCREQVDWIQRFGKLDTNLTIYTKCGQLRVSNKQILNESRAKVKVGANLGFNTKSKITYVNDIIERKKEGLLPHDIFLYMRPSLFDVFIGNKRRNVLDRKRIDFKLEEFFDNLNKLKNSEAIKSIGYLAIGETPSRRFDCKGVLKQSRFPPKVADVWMKENMPCSFRGFPRTQFFISGKFLNKISMRLLHTIREALLNSHGKIGSKKVGRNYFRTKLEQMWDGLMGCPLPQDNKNFCDACGTLTHLKGTGSTKLASLLEVEVDRCYRTNYEGQKKQLCACTSAVQCELKS